ncbi:MAG: flagellar hook-basal body complex protein [Oscillospiraceae bacterium]|jgi:flagellar basal body rod protein FlgG|nr:flagellar hook-basal body complex protein [Oscillospiraceae bacterium]
MQAGFYTAAAGLLSQQRTLNTISNNLANVQTPGYKTERVLTTTFEYEYMNRFEKGCKTNIGFTSPLLQVDDVITDFSESSLEETGFPYDMGLVGEGFFNIKGEEHDFLTRNGNFNIDEEGYLILPDVGRVQGNIANENGNTTQGDIFVGGADFTVNDQGMIWDNTGEYVGTFHISQPEDINEMQKYSNGLFVDENVRDVAVPTIYQGHLERSNIDMNSEYSRVLETQNALVACSTALKLIDQINSRTATLCSIV